MDVSLNIGAGSQNLAHSIREAQGVQKDFGDALNNSQVGEKEEEKKQQALLPFPNQLSVEEKHKVDQLKAQAMQIASQAEEGLTSSQEAQIKSIQQQIGDITGMPMSENLAESAKKLAEQNKVEKKSALNAEEDTELRAEQARMMSGGDDETAQHAGQGMLEHNALVTKIKSMNLKKSSFSGKL